MRPPVIAARVRRGGNNEFIYKKNGAGGRAHSARAGSRHPRILALGSEGDSLLLGGSRSDELRDPLQERQDTDHRRSGQLLGQYQAGGRQGLRLLLLYLQPRLSRGDPRALGRRDRRGGRERSRRQPGVQRSVQVVAALLAAAAHRHGGAARGGVHHHNAQIQRREQQGAQLRQDQGDPGQGQQGAVLRCRGRRRGKAGAPGDRGFPERSQEVHRHRRAHPQGRAARRSSRNGQDPVREGGRGRSQRAVLLHQRLGLRGDVRGRGRVARARPVRASQAQYALHSVHRRDRRGGQTERRGFGRRQRRARADAQPAARPDGRLRVQRQHNRHGGDQPRGYPRPRSHETG